MRLAFRCDAGGRMGSGHLRRCALLAEEALRQNHSVAMLLGTDGNSLWSNYVPAGVEVEIRTERSADVVKELSLWLREVSPDLTVVDHYALVGEKAIEVAQIGVPWAMFDNGLGDHLLYADFIHNALPGYDPADYQGRLAAVNPQLLLGPAYALIRPEFREAVGPAKETGTIAIQFGGGGDRGMILRVLACAFTSLPDWHWNIFTTSANESLPEIRQWLLKNDLNQKVRLFVDEENLAAHLVRADFAISAAGTTLFELAFLRVPTLSCAIVENQMIGGKKWAETGAVEFLGRAHEVSDRQLQEVIVAFANDGDRRASHVRKAQNIVDGNGAVQTIAAFGKLALAA